MSQHDYDIANQAGAAFRADVNLALAAILGLNSGATEPSTTVAGMLWYDTSTGIMKQRNAANSGWVNRWTVANSDEAGSWTPADNSGAALSLTSVSGYYVKRGSLVVASFQLTYPSTADGTTMSINGLPFAMGTGPQEGGYLSHNPLPIAATIIGGGASSTSFRFYGTNSGNRTNAQCSTLTFQGTMIYRT